MNRAVHIRVFYPFICLYLQKFQNKAVFPSRFMSTDTVKFVHREHRFSTCRQAFDTRDMDRSRCAFQLKTDIWKSDWPTSDVAARHFVKSPSWVQGFPFPNALFGSFQMGMRNESHGQVRKTSDVNYSCATRNPRLLPFCNEQRNSCKLIY